MQRGLPRGAEVRIDQVGPQPQGPLRASNEPMKANFNALITSPMLTSTLGPLPLGGNAVVPLMPGNQP
jgi:hypothetical protein